MITEEFYDDIASLLDELVYAHYRKGSGLDWTKRPIPRDVFKDRLRNGLLSLQEEHDFDLEQTITALSGQADKYSSIAVQFENEKQGIENQRVLNSMFWANVVTTAYSARGNADALISDPFTFFILVGAGLLTYCEILRRDGFLGRKLREWCGKYKLPRENQLFLGFQRYPSLADEYISTTTGFIRQILNRAESDNSLI